MITSVLPLYVMFSLHMSPAMFGFIDGLQQGGASLMRLASGLLTDRWRRPKEIAVAGYSASALCRLGLLVVGRSATGLTALTFLDRLGKGVRTSPRDAMISLSAPRQGLAAAFGVHRTLDTLGATLGPVVAFAVLYQMRDAYDVVFVVSFVLALVGVAILVAFVRNPPAVEAAEPSARALHGARELWRDGRFRTISVSVGCLGAATLSDSFVYLLLQRRLNFNPAYLPLLYVATPAVYMLLATPVGWVADRVGRGVVVTAGYTGLLGVYGLMLLPSLGTTTLVLSIGLLGAYYAATDGVVPALTSAVVPPKSRATGLSIVGSSSDVGKIVSGFLFGLLWSRAGAETALGLFAAGLFVTLVLAGPALRRLQRHVDGEVARA